MEQLNKCLRSELSATETYEQALNKFRSEHGQDPKFRALEKFRDDHRDAASQLRALIQQHGGTPTDDSGAWGTWSKTVMGTAKLFGDKSALKALKEGEQSGIDQYDGIEKDADTPAAARSLASTLKTRNHQHVTELDRLLQAT